MAAARAERDVGGKDNTLTPIAEEAENEWAKTTPARGKRSDGRGGSLSSGRIRMRGALHGRLLPGEMRSRKTAPPSSVKRLKSKEAVAVAAVPKKPKPQLKAANSGSMTPSQADLQSTTEEANVERSGVASAQNPRGKTKPSKSERLLKKAEAAFKAAEEQVRAERVSIKKNTKLKDERQRQARERDAKTLKVSPPCPPARCTRAHTHAPARTHK